MTLPSIEEHETVFQTYFEAISGITAYLADPPDVVLDRLLPLAITTALPGDWDTRTLGADSLIVDRRWELAILVEDVQLGREYTKRVQVKPFLTSVPLYLKAHQEIDLGDGRLITVKMHGGGDTGINNVRTYGDKTYAVALFTFFTSCSDVVEPDW